MAEKDLPVRGYRFARVRKPILGCKGMQEDSERECLISLFALCITLPAPAKW